MVLPLGKEKISERLGISLATVNNWIKTQVIPAPNNNNSYSQAAFDSIITMIFILSFLEKNIIQKRC